jgi:hypothetical protein
VFLLEVLRTLARSPSLFNDLVDFGFPSGHRKRESKKMPRHARRFVSAHAFRREERFFSAPEQNEK